MSDLALRIQVWVATTLASMKEERGQDLTEYALWTGVIALALMAAVAFFLLNNPVAGLASGIGRCIDFNSGTSCNPF